LRPLAANLEFVQVLLFTIEGLENRPMQLG
jgi:hypothetical protein